MPALIDNRSPIYCWFGCKMEKSYCNRLVDTKYCGAIRLFEVRMCKKIFNIPNVCH